MNKKLSLYLCYIISALFAVVLTVNSPLLSSMASTFHMNMAQSGMLFTANFIGFAAFILFGGILGDKLNKKLILSISLFGLAVSMLIFTFAGNVYTAVAVMLFIGGFGGIVEGNITAIIAEIYPEKAEFNINMAQVYFGVGALFGPITAGLLISRGVSWQAAYFCLGILVLLSAVIFFIGKISEKVYDEKLSLKSFKLLIGNKAFLLVCLCMFLYTGSEVGSWGWLSTFLKKNLEFSTFKSSLAVGLFWMAMTIGRFICGIFTKKFKTRALVIILAAASGFSTILAGIISSRNLVWVVIILMGLTYSSIWPLIVAFGNRLQDSSKGTVFALMIGSGGVGASVIPLLMGGIAQGINIQFAIISPAILLFLLCFIFIKFKDA